MRVLALSVVSMVACADSTSPAATPAAARGDATPPTPPAPAAAPPPAAPPPAAPDGAIALTDPRLLVQTCVEPHPCPELLQAPGEQHCAALTLGAATGWRLPTKDELERIRGREGFAQSTGYHWTSTPFDQDDAQVWIVDPNAEQPTTVPRDRKPFRIRCVRAP